MRHVVIAGLAMYGSDAGILSGIFHFARTTGSWLIHDAGHDFSNLGRHISELKMEGIIANVTTTATRDLLKGMRLPLVNTSGAMPDSLDIPSVGVDDRQAGHLAGEHFVGRHFRNFAVLPLRRNYHFSRERVAGFIEHVNRSGYGVHIFDPRHKVARYHPPSQWDPCGPLCTLAQVPKPIAVYATTARSGLDFCRRCFEENINIPDEAAVLGTDDLEYVCEMASPPMSSIRLPSRQMGYAAARMLDIMMRGEQPQQTRMVFPAIDVHLRRSTDTIAVTDDVLAKALSFIRDHDDKRIAAVDVADHCGINRRSLERKFRYELRMPIMREIQRVRVDRAVKLLMETSESMEWIAKTAGFRNHDHMGKTFRLLLDRQPSDIRKASQML